MQLEFFMWKEWIKMQLERESLGKIIGPGKESAFSFSE